MRKIKLTIQYDGSAFSGFQIQPEAKTVQQEVENVLGKVLKEKIKLQASGRTDAGVHAIAQVVDFETKNEKMTPVQILKAANVDLPKAVKILDAKIVDSSFESRFSAKKKTYAYRFYLSEVELPLLANQSLQLKKCLNVSKMKKAARFFVGKHDFSAFCASKSGRTDFVRTVFWTKISKLSSFVETNEFVFEICANGFLYNMVRIIFGTLIDVGLGKIESKQIQSIIASKNRQRAGKTAPSFPLFLKKVDY